MAPKSPVSETFTPIGIRKETEHARNAPTQMDAQQADYQNEFIMRDDETLADILARFDEQNAETIRLIDAADLDAAVPSPQHVPWFPKGVPAGSVRWVIVQLIEELARHAGHADIIRETIDGATLYELLAGL